MCSHNGCTAVATHALAKACRQKFGVVCSHNCYTAVATHALAKACRQKLCVMWLHKANPLFVLASRAHTGLSAPAAGSDVDLSGIDNTAY